MASGEPAAVAREQAGEVVDGPFEVTLDPFARHRTFAGWVRTGKLRSSFEWFLEKWREPIDVRADKILDLAAFGKAPHAFLKMPRKKRPDEFPDGYEDRLKKDVERQFILRNLMRYVKTVNRDDPLEFDKKPVGVKVDLDARAHLRSLHRAPELLDDLGHDHARHELDWRRTMHDVMQWEEWFCKEIKEDFSGPLWKHDPVKNPVKAKVADAAAALEKSTATDPAVASAAAAEGASE